MPRAPRSASPAPQPVLRTERLVLSPLADRHLDDEIALDADPEVMRHLTGRASTVEEVREAHRRRLRIAREHPGLGFWVGTLDGTFVGWWILEPPERVEQRRPGRAELGYRLHRRFWRQGLASEGARALLDHGFSTLGLESVIAETMAVNLASRATMATLGMEHVATVHLDFDVPLPGAEQGDVVYELRRRPGAATP